MKLECHRCKSTYQLLMEEKKDPDTGEVLSKQFVCFRCADKIVERGKAVYDDSQGKIK